MIVDLGSQSPGELPAFDVCIAGAGVAGLTIALQLAARGRSVALIEAGDRNGGSASQAFYRGDNTGVENLPLDQTRLRMLGGSSNHWGGWCRLLDPYDLARTDLTGAAWPITTDDLAPYAAKAASILGVNAQSASSDLPLDDGAGNLQTIRMLFSQPPAHLGDRFYDALEMTPNLTLFVNAAVTELELDAAQSRVTGMTVRSPAAGGGFVARGTQYVLALGSVETARMLLLWNRTYGDRIANPKLIGRYYLQHLHQSLGQFVVLDGGGAPSAAAPNADNVFLASTEAYLRTSGSGAFRLYSTGIACGGLANELSAVASTATCTAITGGGELFITGEQMPNANSHVEFSGEADAFGLPRARLDWEITERDAAMLRQAALEFGRYLVRANLGRLKVNPVVLDGAAPLTGWSKLPSAPGAAGHQMGGMRMSQTADDGVTDPQCRLWNVDNLYVGGSGVFRTCGHANPTLTLTQLALRLADTLDARLAAP